MGELFHPGLQGVIAGETEICRIDGKFQYRGYCVAELIRGASFLEVVYLLLYDELPSEEEFVDFLSIITEEQELPDIVLRVFESLPVHTTPLEAMRTGLAILSHFDPQPGEDLLHVGHTQTIRMLAKAPLLLGAWHRQHHGQSPVPIDPTLGYVSNLYRVILGSTPCVLHEQALEAALICIVEHEFNPSSYVARIVGSTKSSQYGPVLGALEAFMGMDHRGGDDRPLDVLDEVGQLSGVEDWVDRLAPEEPVPGFGHPVHLDEDPRVPLLAATCSRLAESCGRSDMEILALSVQKKVWEKRRLAPNVDWPLCRLLSYLGFSRELFKPLFATARMVGWSAHALEQCESNTVIRPRARYRGAEDCPFEPMHRRCF